MPRPIRKPRKPPILASAASIPNVQIVGSARSPLPSTSADVAASSPQTRMRTTRATHREDRDDEKRASRSSLVHVRADTEDDEDSESSTSKTAHANEIEQEECVVLKTRDLLNLLPRPQRPFKRKSRARIASDDHDPLHAARQTRKVVSKKKRSIREPQHKHVDTDSEEPDEPDSLGLSVEAQSRLHSIRTQFEEVDRWDMDTETVSSAFYSS